MRLKLCVTLVCAGLLTACDETQPTAASAPPSAAPVAGSQRLGAGQLPPETFPLSGARVISQAGENTAIVEVNRPVNFPQSTTQVRRAAQAWCGRDATALRQSTSRSTMSSRTRYLVRCR